MPEKVTANSTRACQILPVLRSWLMVRDFTHRTHAHPMRNNQRTANRLAVVEFRTVTRSLCHALKGPGHANVCDPSVVRARGCHTDIACSFPQWFFSRCRITAIHDSLWRSPTGHKKSQFAKQGEMPVRPQVARGGDSSGMHPKLPRQRWCMQRFSIICP